jgi:hypothetical protein
MRILLCALVTLMLAGCVVYPGHGYYRDGHYYSNGYSRSGDHGSYYDHDRNGYYR